MLGFLTLEAELGAAARSLLRLGDRLTLVVEEET